MTPEEALELIKNDEGMQWELADFENNPTHGSRPTEENYWSPNVEAGRKVRVSYHYETPIGQPYYLRPSSEPLIRWEDEITL